ncbi:MAG: hypothetical protein JST42_23610 [Bacteroidetes bacterium]|nr:hypothetical protein [Bacteroidota bacterium]
MSPIQVSGLNGVRRAATGHSFIRLDRDGGALSAKQIVMLDEHYGNKALAETLRSANKTGFDYSVRATDHPFTNRRLALMKKLLEFLDR